MDAGSEDAQDVRYFSGGRRTVVRHLSLVGSVLLTNDEGLTTNDFLRRVASSEADPPYHVTLLDLEAFCDNWLECFVTIYLHDKLNFAFSPFWRLPFLSAATEKEAKECRPGTQAFILNSENKSAFFTPDFCGCCGTHES